MTKILLSRKDIKKIQSILDKFPYVDNFELEYNCSSGIGTNINIIIRAEIGDIEGNFTVPITSIEGW